MVVSRDDRIVYLHEGICKLLAAPRQVREMSRASAAPSAFVLVHILTMLIHLDQLG